MGEKQPYVVVIIVQVIYTGMYVISKAALDGGLSSFTFIFYRQLTSAILLLPLAFIFERKAPPPLPLSLLLKITMHALIGITFGMNVYNVGLKYTSATVVSATTNSIPVMTFFMAFLMRMETLQFKSLAGISKAMGIALCLGGVLTIAFYSGPKLNPLVKHQLFGNNTSSTNSFQTESKWVKGTFLIITANTAWSLWLVLQGFLLKEYQSKLLFTTIESVLSTVQCFIVALAFERDMSRWKLQLDMGLLAIAYCGFVVTAISFYLQSWCIEKKGPVFLAMSTPLALVFTIVCSSVFLGEVIPLGRYALPSYMDSIRYQISELFIKILFVSQLSMTSGELLCLKQIISKNL
ncbi:WAT1-related protein [Apostasia shenzhenica]|uniref:WAT1-related protein n=1 Tax=Apostasia shenzhenica TaxID=1088818 RepID=A0A2I0AEM0_9ASPA|nr:WAT1-related protein [Apostasia shenzhenica]